MARTNEVTLGAAIDAVLKSCNLRHGVYEAKIQSLWAEVMGKTVARYTISVQLNGNRLYVVVDSAPLKSELFYSRDKIKEVINREIGAEIIKDVFIY
jgi:hypothetical protein